MREYILLTALLVVLFFPAKAQKEGTHWYFGKEAGVDFVAGTAAATKRGKINSNESSSAICDGQGQLKFYTGGSLAFNANHQVMPNGRGLQGNATSSNSNMIVPIPEDPDRFMIFTTGGAATEFGNFGSGFRYSVVDMTLDGGLGDITMKNIPLMGRSSEKMAAIPHANECDVWVIGHLYDSRDFRAFQITKDGVDPTAVTSSIGSLHQGTILGAMNVPYEGNARGCMAASLDGTRLAVAINVDGIVEVFDFDPATGQVSNPLSLKLQRRVYGVCFSPDGKILYVTERRLDGRVSQFDLSSGDVATINASETVLARVPGDGPGALQLGPDGKIYCAQWRHKYLAAINNPNVLGVGCDFEAESLFLKRRECGLGLPTMMVSLLTVPGINVFNRCAGENTFFHFDDIGLVDSAKWDFGDPASGDNNQSNVLTPTHRFSAGGTFQVTLTRFVNGLATSKAEDVLILSKPNTDLGRDTVLCTGETLSFDVTSPGKDVTYRWQDGTTLPTFTIQSEGQYEVSVTNGCGTTTSAIVVPIIDPPAVSLGPDFTLCKDSTQLISVTQARLTGYTWSDGSRGDDFLVTMPGTYYLNAVNACGTAVDSLIVTEGDCDCKLFLPNILTPNGDQINDAFAPLYNCQVTTFSLHIFDRWGNQVFESDAYDQQWDGTCGNGNCPTGVYYYVLKFKGDPLVEAEDEMHRGNVTLLR